MYLFGPGALFAVPLTDVNSNVIANPTPIQFGALQDVSLDIQFDLKELYGQQQFAMDIARGKGKITGKAKKAIVNGALFNNLFLGMALTNSIVADYDDIVGVAIPATTYMITPNLPTNATWSTDFGVSDINFRPFTRIASPTQGATCSYATNVMTCTVAPTVGTFQVGQIVTAAGVAAGTTITSLGTGNGGLGTYNLSTSPGTIAPEATTAGGPAATRQYSLVPAVQGATCSYATNVMTCTVAPTTGAFAPGQTITAAGVPLGTTITSFGTGTGGLGTYNLSTSPGTITAEATIAGTAYLFYSGDVGVVAFINCQYTNTSATASKIVLTNPNLGSTPTFRADLSIPYEGKSLIVTLPACVSSKLTLATKLDDYTIPEFDFTAFGPNGTSPMTLAMSE